MASPSAIARAEAPARTRRGPRVVAAHRPINALRNGVTWIALVGLLLAGVVALNVAVLQLNVRLDKLSRERVSLRAKNAVLSSQLSSANASPRVQALAHKRLGLVPAAPDDTMYVVLRGR